MNDVAGRSGHKLRCAVIGSGNIGTDLVFKIDRSPHLQLAMVIGIDPNSDGLRIARERGHVTSTKGIAGLGELSTPPDVVFDGSSAEAHRSHDPVLREMGVPHVLDLTPAGLGPAVYPTINSDDHLAARNLSFVSCASQATVPIVAALSGVCEIDYAETVSTLASRSAGPGTRVSVDDFTYKTTRALEDVGGARRGKSVLVLNPCEPPMIMRNTVYVESATELDEATVAQVLDEQVERLRAAVPGYRVRRHVVDDRIIRVFTEVEGAGDYLPRYAGNLDIITAAAVAVAERIATLPAREVVA
jgi:acetaldehyde dehydrogenase